MILLAIDPGPQQSAWMLYDTETGRPIAHAKEDNRSHVSIRIRSHYFWGHDNADGPDYRPDALVIEGMAFMGMSVGQEVFDACIWIGRFLEAWEANHKGRGELLYRRDVKLHLCGSSRAKDPNVRQSLIDRYGPGKEIAIGRKAAPGPLYGISSDRWSCLALACTWADTKLVSSMPATAGEASDAQ